MVDTVTNRAVVTAIVAILDNMTKTKSQKQRNKMMKQKMAKEFNFLNGNTLSLNLKKGRRAQKSIGNPVMTRVSAPVAKSFRGGVTRAKVTQLGSGVTRVKHSEYISDVVGSMDFALEATPLNPGESGLFPWLSTIARRYESYLFRDLNFRFETTSPTSTAGSVILAADYNPQSDPPVGKVQALAMESSVRTPPWTSVVHKSLPHNLSKRKSYYVRKGESVDDPDLYDTGVFMTMVEGVPTETGSIGEMHVDYIVDLITPTLDNNDVSGEAVFIDCLTDTLDDTRKFDFLFEPTVLYTPDDRNFTAGPGIHVDGTQGSNTGTVGAIRFHNVGVYLVSIEFGVPGALQDTTSLVLPTTGDLWTAGIEDAPGSSGPVPSEYVTVIPANGDSVMVDTVTNRAVVTAIVAIRSDNAVFGVGSTQAVGTGQTGLVSSRIYIAPYTDSAMTFNSSTKGKYSAYRGTVLSSLKLPSRSLSDLFIEDRKRREKKREAVTIRTLLKELAGLRLEIDDIRHCSPHHYGDAGPVSPGKVKQGPKTVGFR